jgi:phosphate starvation-inducible PhoH-like protein
MAMQATIDISAYDPVEFLGVNNQNLNFIQTCFPKLRIVSRGTKITALGDEESIEKFRELILAIKVHYEDYNFIDFDTIEELVKGRRPQVYKKQDNNLIVFGNKGKVIEARTHNQKKLVEAIEKCDLVFAVGPAGTGKTYTAIALASRALKNKEVKRIILTRPAVEAGEQLGFLPGDMKDKLEPYLQPLYDALADIFPKKKLQEMLDERIVEVAPLAYMRGRTLEHAFVILDEAQNTSDKQLKMFLTRMGEHAKFIITGDVSQVDLPRNTHSGLLQAIELFEKTDGIQFVFFDKNDIMRHSIVKKIIEIYEKKDA